MDERMNYAKAAPRAYQALLAFNDVVEQSDLEPLLLELVRTRVSQLNSCAFCLDMHTKDARALGESEQRLYGLSAWRESPYYSDRERAALAWAEEITLISQTHASDAAYAEARAQFSEAELAELTMVIVVINSWNRLAVGFRKRAGGYRSSRQPLAGR